MATAKKKKTVVLTQQYLKTHLYAAIEASEVRVRTAFIDARDAMLRKRETESSLLATESRIRNTILERMPSIREELQQMREVVNGVENVQDVNANRIVSAVHEVRDYLVHYNARDQEEANKELKALEITAANVITLKEHLAVANSHVQRLVAEKEVLRSYCKNLEIQNKELTKGRTDTEILLRSSLLRTTMILGRVVTAWKSRHISKMEVMDATIKRADEVLEQVETNLENANV